MLVREEIDHMEEIMCVSSKEEIEECVDVE
jgi:hypothetical protein